MHESSLRHIRCVRCGKKLSLDVLKKDGEIREGFLFCAICVLHFPIIGKIPILWDDFAIYLSNRPRLGGMLYAKASTQRLKLYIKDKLGSISKNRTDVSLVEKRWSSIYEKNKKSKFYDMVKKSLDKMSHSGTVLEHGCSIGIMTRHLAKSHNVFGIDKSYHAIEIAKKSDSENVDYFVADSLSHPFGKARFDSVIGLNLFEIIEPKLFLRSLSKQVKKDGFLVLSDPYDFERGEKSVREPLYEESVRSELGRLGFSISKETKNPAYLPWSLKLHRRAMLQYKVDLIIGKKR
ncbi:class I SAM-dependent methyltransferase [Candidatus Nitrosotenuis sp. DW1]|uniref:class I SAM-dependent methyltransferase n=1 Tax=Candidatus Nitrosotenuis sp. DW1 TaxID=2259672 RepID=UPI0015CA406D|nr:class I SAM-dependent methyltransferase [Candidatus Nitrosotenuis sp. DW1]QLH10012.1 methyltransferase type 11 [Candidatus Nitrosotenuis sp. DW1]